MPANPPLKDAKNYKIVGQRIHRIDTPSKVDGTAGFGIDFRLPDMKFALLARCPVIGGKVASFDDKDSKKVGGVGYVGKISDSAVAVVADSVWGAMEGRRLLNVTWDEGPNKDLNSAAIYDGLKKSVTGKAVTMYSVGDVAKAAGRRIEAAYQLPFMAHAPMEPGNTVAHYRGEQVRVVVADAGPAGCPRLRRDRRGLDPDQVKVNITLLGGGFGRRLEHDYGVEAALVSKAINGPVQVLWTREDDMQHSTYRPASYHHLSAVLDGAGWPVAFSHRIVMPGINVQKGYPAVDGIDSEVKDESSFIYSYPNALVDYVMTETPVPLGWMRSVNALQAAFASECFLDELAVAAGKDPLALRLHLLDERRRPQWLEVGAHSRRAANGR